jgi:glycosyltransferase involved in cell wall biosynthesis
MKLCVFSSDPLYKYYEKGEIKARYWNPEDMFDEVCVFSFCPEDIAAERVQELTGRARLRVVPLGSPSPWRLHAQYRRAVAELGAMRPDLVRVHNPWHAGLVGVRAAKRLGIPVVLSLHTHYGARRQWEGGWLLQALRLSEGYSIRRADRVLCVSHYVADYARQMGARSVEVIYNRVYLEQFRCERRDMHDPPVILCVGRLDPPKDQECLVRAIQGLDVVLHLVGDGINRRRLEGLVEDLGLRSKVCFFGAVPHHRIQSYYARADIFALATHYEGFCIPVLEAMAAGLPVVVSDTQPLPEILGGAGLVVRHHAEGFREAFVDLMGLARKREALARLASERAAALDGTLMERREAQLYAGMIQDSRRKLSTG